MPKRKPAAQKQSVSAKFVAVVAEPDPPVVQQQCDKLLQELAQHADKLTIPRVKTTAPRKKWEYANVPPMYAPGRIDMCLAPLDIKAIHEVEACLAADPTASVLLLGHSGCGKTATLFNLAAKRWILFMDANTHPCDRSYDALSHDLFIKLKYGGGEIAGQRKEYLEWCKKLIVKHFLLRLLLLRWFRARHPRHTPAQFLGFQIQHCANWTLSIEDMFEQCKPSLQELIECYRHLAKHDQPVVAIDDAHHCAVGSGSFPSVSQWQAALHDPSTDWNALPTARTVLTLISVVLTELLQQPTVYATRKLWPSGADVLAVGSKGVQIVTDFDTLTLGQAAEFVTSVVGPPMTVDMLKGQSRLQGRPRLAANTVRNLAGDSLGRDTDLGSAIDKAALQGRRQLFALLKQAFDESTDKKEFAQTILRMVIGIKLHDGKVAFPITPNVNLFECALAQVVPMSTTASQETRFMQQVLHEEISRDVLASWLEHEQPKLDEWLQNASEKKLAKKLAQGEYVLLS